MSVDLPVSLNAWSVTDEAGLRATRRHDEIAGDVVNAVLQTASPPQQDNVETAQELSDLVSEQAWIAALCQARVRRSTRCRRNNRFDGSSTGTALGLGIEPRVPDFISSIRDGHISLPSDFRSDPFGTVFPRKLSESRRKKRSFSRVPFFNPPPTGLPIMQSP
jgi:hypothetical protein